MESKLTTRQWRLHDYVKAQNGRHVSKREIYEHVDGYEWHQEYSDKCPSIRNDMKAINASPECDAVIVFAKQEYYWASKDEIMDFINRKLKSIKVASKEISELSAKLAMDNQGKLLNNQGREVSDGNEQFHETTR